MMAQWRESFARWLWAAVAVAGVCATALAIRIATFPVTVSEGDYDAGIVLGARVVDGVPTPAFAARIDHAISLYHKGTIRNIVFTGGNELPKALYDSEAARDYALRNGVPADVTFVETRSRTTLQNLTEARRIIQENRWNRVLVISDPYHLYRASWQAKSLGLNADVSATPTTQYRTCYRKGPFLLRETYFTCHFWVFRQ